MARRYSCERIIPPRANKIHRLSKLVEAQNKARENLHKMGLQNLWKSDQCHEHVRPMPKSAERSHVSGGGSVRFFHTRNIRVTTRVGAQVSSTSKNTHIERQVVNNQSESRVHDTVEGHLAHLPEHCQSRKGREAKQVLCKHRIHHNLKSNVDEISSVHNHGTSARELK